MVPELKNKKHELLCQEFMIDLCQTQAAIRAGYSPKSARQQSTKLFANASIRARVEELQAERSQRTGISADRVLRELARIGFVNAPDVINMESAAIASGAAADDTAAIASVKVKTIPTEDGDITEREVRLHDKQKALELLGRHLGIFNDKLNITGAVPVIISGEDKLEE